MLDAMSLKPRAKSHAYIPFGHCAKAEGGIWIEPGSGDASRAMLIGDLGAMVSAFPGDAG